MNDPNIPGPDDVLEQAAAWKADGDAVALATVVATWGSSPRPVGSQLAIKGDGASPFESGHLRVVIQRLDALDPRTYAWIRI